MSFHKSYQRKIKMSNIKYSNLLVNIFVQEIFQEKYDINLIKIELYLFWKLKLFARGKLQRKIVHFATKFDLPESNCIF